jgi:hypothetical protein
VATYRLYTECEYCDQRHPLPFGICMNLIIPEERSINDIFNRKRPPDDIISIIKNRTICPNTDKNFFQSDPDKIFMIPTRQIVSN